MARKNLQVPLPPETFSTLRVEAEATGIPVTALDQAKRTGRIGSFSPIDLDRLAAGLRAAPTLV